MHKLYDLKEKLIREMEEYDGKQELSRTDVETIKYLSSAVDHMCNILDNEEERDDYSHSYDMRRGSMYPTYSRSRRRDSMGRYSNAEDNFKMELEELIKEAPNDHIRQKMQDIMYGM